MIYIAHPSVVQQPQRRFTNFVEKVNYKKIARNAKKKEKKKIKR